MLFNFIFLEYKSEENETENPIQFDIEYSPTCEWDYLEIFDGPDRNSKSLGRFCGKEPPRYVKSTGPVLTIVFITDEFISSPGFTVEWSQSLGPLQDRL